MSLMCLVPWPANTTPVLHFTLVQELLGLSSSAHQIFLLGHLCMLPSRPCGAVPRFLQQKHPILLVEQLHPVSPTLLCLAHVADGATITCGT